MEKIWIELIEDYHLKGISLSAMTSLLYLKGYKGDRYFELRKKIFKECQRIETKKHKGKKLVYIE